MITKFDSFLNESNSIISIADVEKVIKEIFDDTKVSSVETVYEKDENGNLKLVVTINNLFYDRTNIIHTKFIFYTDKDKRKLMTNKMSYLYDINCNFRMINFNDSEELKNSINKIIEDRIFGEDIILLSDLSIILSSEVNKWLDGNDVTTSLYSINYTPIVGSIPCNSLVFHFELNIDNTRDIKMIIKKVDMADFKVTFNENDWFKDVNISSLKSLPQTVGEMIKKHIKE